MKKLENEQLVKVTGGSTAINGTILNAIARAISSLFSVGEAAGGAIRRIKEDNLCPLN